MQGQFAHLIKMDKHVVEKEDKQKNPRNLKASDVYMSPYFIMKPNIPIRHSEN